MKRAHTGALLLALGGCAGPQMPPAPSLTVGVLALPSGLDPARHDDFATDAIAKDVFATLVDVRPGTSDVVPGLASTWSASSDGTAWTFRLRKNLQFSDGTPVDAAAVKFNFDRWRSTQDPNRGDGAYPAYAARFGGYDDASQIAGVDAPAPDTVVIHTRQRFAPLLRDIALPAFGIGSPKAIAWSVPAFDEVPVGSGPYEIDGVAEGDHVSLVRNPLWDVGALTYASSIVRFIPDPPTARLALDKRDIDAVLDPTADVLPDFRSRNERFVSGPIDTVAYLAFDTTRPPFADERLRRAVAKALDVVAVARAAGQAARPARGLLPPGLLGADPAQAPGRSDLDAARALLRGANLPSAIALYYAGSAPPQLPDPAAVAQELRTELAAVGINVVPQPMGPPVVLPAPGLDGAIGLVVTEAPSGEPDDVFGPIAAGWSDPAFHVLFAAARTTLDDAARAKVYRSMSAMVRDRVVAVPLVYPVAQSAVAPSLDLDAYPMFDGYR